LQEHIVTAVAGNSCQASASICLECGDGKLELYSESRHQVHCIKMGVMPN